MSEDRDRRLVDEVFGTTQVPPRPGLAARARSRLDRERSRRTAPRLGTQALLGLALTAVLVVGGLQAGGVLENVGAPASPPSNATLANDLPSSSAVQPTFALRRAGAATSAPPSRFDWEGRLAGTFQLPDGGAGARASPDGAAAALPDDSGPGAEIVDVSGRAILHLPAFGAWSGDGAHVVCALKGAGHPAEVEVTDLDQEGRPRPVDHQVTGGGFLDGTWVLAGCSLRSDLLVALRLDGAGALLEADSIQLSSGHLLSRVTYPPGAGPTSRVLSHDARYLAEYDAAQGTTSIRDLRSGAVAGTVPGAVVAFSGDDQLVLANESGGAVAANLVAWQSGQVSWSAAGAARPLAERPQGRDFALTLTPPGGAARTLLVTGGGSRIIDLAGYGPALVQAAG